MEKITASLGTLLEQAPITIETYLREAIARIDRVYDAPGYAQAHPELVAAFLHACTHDLRTSMLGAVLQELSDTVDAANAAIGDALEDIHSALTDGLIIYNPGN